MLVGSQHFPTRLGIFGDYDWSVEIRGPLPRKVQHALLHGDVLSMEQNDRLPLIEGLIIFWETRGRASDAQKTTIFLLDCRSTLHILTRPIRVL